MKGYLSQFLSETPKVYPLTQISSKDTSKATPEMPRFGL